MKISEEEINRKRKHNNQPDFQVTFAELDEEDNDMLSLSLSLPPTSRPRRLSPIQPPLPPPPPPQLFSLPPLQLPPSLSLPPTSRPRRLSPIQPRLPPPPQLFSLPPLQLPPSHPLLAPSFTPDSSIYRQDGVSERPSRIWRNPTQVPRQGKSDTVPVLYPWATNHRATVHTLNYLLSQQISTITGDVQCKRCERQYEIGYDLRDKFVEIGSSIANNKCFMNDRAPSNWMNPILPTCKFCGQESSVKPVMPEKKKAINWLFLLLGEMVGCCTLEQLKYFCKHTKNHRTGAKDRVLYLTYLGLCKQLDPSGPFGR